MNACWILLQLITVQLLEYRGDISELRGLFTIRNRVNFPEDLNRGDMSDFL
jgi:hypothetical protein